MRTIEEIAARGVKKLRALGDSIPQWEPSGNNNTSAWACNRTGCPVQANVSHDGSSIEIEIEDHESTPTLSVNGIQIDLDHLLRFTKMDCSPERSTIAARVAVEVLGNSPARSAFLELQLFQVEDLAELAALILDPPEKENLPGRPDERT